MRYHLCRRGCCWLAAKCQVLGDEPESWMRHEPVPVCVCVCSCHLQKEFDLPLSVFFFLICKYSGQDFPGLCWVRLVTVWPLSLIFEEVLDLSSCSVWGCVSWSWIHHWWWSLVLILVDWQSRSNEVQWRDERRNCRAKVFKACPGAWEE